MLVVSVEEEDSDAVKLAVRLGVLVEVADCDELFEPLGVSEDESDMVCVMDLVADRL